MHVCLVALNALPAIDPEVAGPIGGVETRAWQFARGLARQPATQVTLVVRHHRSREPFVREGVRVVPIIDRMYPVWQDVGTAIVREAGFPGVRLRQFHPRLLWQVPAAAIDRLIFGKRYATTRPDAAIQRIGGDIYMTFGVQTHSLRVIRSAEAIGRPTLLMLGSDGDLDPLFLRGTAGFDPYGTAAAVGRAIIREASRIVAQTPSQQQTLSRDFHRSAMVVRNPMDVPAWERGLATATMPEELAGADGYVLWVGRAEALHKRPQLCIALAEQCPALTFVMVLNPRDSAVEELVRRAAPGNVRIMRQVPFEQMPALFRQASVFLSTSSLEGFPNVFLQSAVSGVPIVSLEVGAEFLTAAEAGELCSGRSRGCGQCAERYVNLTAEQRAAGTKTSGYVIEHHGLERQSSMLRVC
ncbi:MAG: glycosyltransferase [Planctomycetaceae bacterium]